MSDDPSTNYSAYLKKHGFRVGPDHAVIVAASGDDIERDESPTIIVCSICQHQLNRMTNHRDGSESWIHARGWNRYDHEPEPVEVPRPAFHTRTDLMCDFCGVASSVHWGYTGDRLQQVSGNFGNDMGNKWAACQACADLIDQGDAEGTAQRAVAASSIGRKTSAGIRPRMLHELTQLHGSFISTIREKNYLGPPVTPMKLTPKILPKIQQGLTRFWEHPDCARLMFSYASHSLPGSIAGHPDAFTVRYGKGQQVDADARNKLLHHLHVGSQAAQLYWVSADFTRLATLAGLDLTTIEIRRDQLPSPHGLIFWETPIGEIKRTYGTAAIRAIGWTLVPGGVWVNVYVQSEDGRPDLLPVLEEHRAEFGWLVSLNPGSGIPFTTAPDTMLTPEQLASWTTVTDEFRQAGNFLLTLIATWYLLRQPGVAEQRTAPVDKKAARTYQRNTGRPIPEVTLIDLRKRPKVERKDGEKKSWELKYKRFTSGHWRNQWYPSRAEHEQIYISPYIAGADKPWRPDEDAVPTVKVLR